MGNRKVAVIGAGPAGCMLARLLHLKGVDVTIFEGEASPNFRSQGGTLDLHTTTGLAAMKEADLWDEFLEHGRYDGQYMAITDRHLEYMFVRSADKVSNSHEERPEIDRFRLREILCNSLPDGMIKWGHRLSKVDGQTLVFENGTKADGFELIVGADGAWSKVRVSIAPDLQPVYTGVSMHELHIPDAEKTAPDVYKLVNRGSIFASAEGSRLSFQQMGDDSINVQTSFVEADPEWMRPSKCDYDPTSADETVPALLRTKYSDWDPRLREVLERTRGQCWARALYMLPVGGRWPHRAGVTLIGDAAHLMTPWAGEGANQALDDSRLLARAIVRALDKDDDAATLDAAVRDAEVAMLKRTTEMQQLSADLMQDWFFTPGAPQSVMATAISRHVRHAMPWVLQPLGVMAVHGYYFWKSLFYKK